jgi:hypothetical protein
MSDQQTISCTEAYNRGLDEAVAESSSVILLSEDIVDDDPLYRYDTARSFARCGVCVF